MKMLDLPENHSDQVRWLERAMMGPGFDRVIAELSAVFGNQSLELSDAEEQSILGRGLSELTPGRFRTLLKSPTTLVKLQRTVIEFGGDYWNSITPSDSQTAILEAARPAAPPSTLRRDRPKQSWVSNGISAAVGALVTAAALMILLAASRGQQNVPAGLAENSTPNAEVNVEPSSWGFEKFANSAMASATDVDREDYFANIASAAEAWSNKRPATPAALAKRLGEFRMGCSALLLADHPLPVDDKQWLKDRCQKWATAIENHLAELEGGMSVEEVTQRVDATVTKIAAAIKGRSATS